MAILYGVAGNPIAHSRSPQIHQAFAHQFGLILDYKKILLPLDGFVQGVQKFQTEGGLGLNVTLPFKSQALVVADEITPRAQLAHAANTLIFRNQQIIADCTDGEGLIRDLQRLQVPVSNARIALLGAGGAARGILAPLLACHPQQLIIFNRTIERAEQLVKEFQFLGPLAVGDPNSSATFDLIINATSISLSSRTFDCRLHLAENAFAYDLVYSSVATPFMRWAQEQRACTVDGWGMLVEQAASAFYLWHGLQPETHTLIKERFVKQD